MLGRRRARRGEKQPAGRRTPAAATELIQAFYPRLFAYALSLSGDTQRAKEVVAAAFDQALAGGEPVEAVRLFLLARLGLMSALSQGGGRGEPPCDDPALAALTDALGQLPAPEREVLALRFDGRLSYEEISQITGENQQAISLRVLHSMQYLRQALGPLPSPRLS